MNGKRIVFWSLSITLLISMSTAELFGQADRGVIRGTVTDVTGAVVPGARITATRVSTNTRFNTTSTATGDYTIPTLQAGEYSLNVEADGFKSFTRTNIFVIAGGTANADATLEVGQLTETVEVVSSLAQLETTSARVQASVSTKMMDELPLVVGGAMRSPFDLALVTPEANQFGGDNAFQIGGGQGAAYGATMDGVSILTGRFSSVQWASVNTPSVDAIQEFTVESSGFKAEYGRGQGGMMSFSTKSGTNEFHGTAYEFFRNNALDTRRFFEAQKGVLKQNDFGWSAGGPVYIPGLYDGRNKTFVFSSMEWFRDRVGAASQFFNVPTAEMYDGDFRNWVDGNNQLAIIYDPATTRPNPSGSGFIRDPFPNNQVPQGRFSEFSKGVLSVARGVALPNNAGPAGTSAYVRDNYINASGTVLNPWTKFSIKVDHNLTDNARFSYLYNWGLHDGPAPGADGFPGLPLPLNTTRQGRQKSPLHRLTYTHVLSPTVVNSLYGGGQDWKERNASPNVGGDWQARGVCLKNAFDCNENFPILNFDDFQSWGGSAGDGSENTVYSIGDDLTITRGAHTFKAGYLYERQHYNGFGRQSLMGQADFRRRSTSIPGNNDLSTGGGNGFASFLLGEAFAGGTENDRFVGQQWISHGWYFQDDWKLTPRLTMNIGVRYEFTQPPVERDDKWSDFTPDRPNPGATRLDGTPLLGALRFAGFGEGRENSRSIVDGWYGGIAPRLGFAYQLDNKTVLRASGGIYNGIVKTTTGSTHFEGAIIIFRPASTDNGITPAFRADEGLPSYPLPPFINAAFSNGNDTAYWDSEAVRLPQNYQYTFSIQRQVRDSWVLEAAYNANIGAHLVAGIKNTNQLPLSLLDTLGNNVLGSPLNSATARAAGIQVPYAEIFQHFGANVSVAQALRPFPQYRTVNTHSGIGDKSGHSTYHAMVLKADKRYASGVTLQGSYVFSKTLSDTFIYGEATTAQDHYNRRLEKSISSLDRTHNAKFSYILELPFGKGRRWMNKGGVAHAVLGGWRLSGIHFYSSGAPIGLSNSNTFNTFSGRQNALYMDQVGTYDGWVVKHDNPDWKGSDRFFQPASFFGNQSAASLGRTRPGDATRLNPLARGRAGLTENFSLAKTFDFTERIRMDLRWEAFNAFNRSIFNTGSTSVTSPQFGQVNGTTNDPRRMQFGLKVYW
jgi:hypothetical protein